MDWRVPDGDEARTWVKSWGGPYPRLEQDWWMTSGRHSIICFEETGAFTCNLDARAFLNGWPYDRVPAATFPEVQARRDRYSQLGDEALDEGTDLWERDIRPEVEGLLRELRRRRPRNDGNLRGLADHVARCLEAAGHIMGDLHWRMAFGIPGDWASEYPALTGGTPGDAALFLQGLDHATSRLLKRLRTLARMQRDGDAGFEDAFADLIARFGTRTGRGYGSAAGFADVTWSIDPSAVRELIDLYARADLDRLDEREAASKRSRQQAVRRMRRRFQDDADVWPKLERAHHAAIARCKAMENHNHLMEQETEGILRQAVHRLGTAFVAAGVLDHADDVFHLHLEELQELARHPNTTDARALVAERRAELASQADLEPPPHVGAPPAMPPNMKPIEQPPVAEHADGELPGVAASPGVATGRARVVPDMAGFPEVEPGDILVARDAGPAWTPVFALLGGLVLDEGWTIQHAAIVCREVGIPCVLATGAATRTFEDGSLVTVDGDQGWVRVAG